MVKWKKDNIAATKISKTTTKKTTKKKWRPPKEFKYKEVKTKEDLKKVKMSLKDQKQAAKVMWEQMEKDKSIVNKESNYNRFEKFYLKWITSPTVLSEHIWVSRKTIYEFVDRFEKWLRIEWNNRSVVVEHTKMSRKLDLVQTEIWKTISRCSAKWDERGKITAMNALIQSLKLEWDLFNLFKQWDNIFIWDNMKVNNVQSNELSNFERTIKDIKSVFKWANKSSWGENPPVITIPRSDWWDWLDTWGG